MGKGNLVITRTATQYKYENGSVIVEGQIARSVDENKVQEFTGIVRKPGENGVPGEMIGNFRGVQRGEEMNYSFNEMTLDNQDVIQEVIRELEPELITTEKEQEAE